MGRECLECRENDKQFHTNMHYKCHNENCENYIVPTTVTKTMLKPPDDYKNKLILELIQQLFEKENEIFMLKHELSLRKASS